MSGTYFPRRIFTVCYSQLTSCRLLPTCACRLQVKKVVTMLEDLQTQVIEEGKAEAGTYDKFACFCKDMTDDKTDAITTGQASVEDLTATMNDKNSARAEVDTEIAGLNEDITRMNDEIAAAKAQRKKDRAEYLKNKADVKDRLSEGRSVPSVTVHISRSGLLCR